MIGSPGSGKSVFFRNYLADNYMRINNDTIQNPSKALKFCEDFLLEGKSVVIDNMNSTAQQRSVYLHLAKKLKIPIRALYLLTDKETCMHNNSLRKVHTDDIQHLSKAISKVVIHTYFKNHVAPTEKEGFS